MKQVTMLLRTSRVVNDSVAQRELEDATTDTSNSLLRWAEAAAAPPDERNTVPTGAALRYMQQLYKSGTQGEIGRSGIEGINGCSIRGEDDRNAVRSSMVPCGATPL